MKRSSKLLMFLGATLLAFSARAEKPLHDYEGIAAEIAQYAKISNFSIQEVPEERGGQLAYNIVYRNVENLMVYQANEIYLNYAKMNKLPEGAVRFIIAHELAHGKLHHGDPALYGDIPPTQTPNANADRVNPQYGPMRYVPPMYPPVPYGVPPAGMPLPPPYVVPYPNQYYNYPYQPHSQYRGGGTTQMKPERYMHKPTSAWDHHMMEIKADLMGLKLAVCASKDPITHEDLESVGSKFRTKKTSSTHPSWKKRLGIIDNVYHSEGKEKFTCVDGKVVAE